MWLLRTNRAEIKFFVSPEAVPAPGFAILSHVWGDAEQTFQETETLRVRCSTTAVNPRDLATEKIRKACELAQQHGYEWLWVDTCCIDKTSSAELSEAINSMFHYYALATVCYAFLRDVPLSKDDDPTDFFDTPRSRDSSLPRAFSLSQWHRRGWTLQELIAPRNVLFLSQSWDVLGSKADFAPFLEHITGISEELLRMEKRCVDFSVAQRMSWAAGRITTRIEDEAYCLLGIFAINMPTLYGEGRNAFRRLQEEIMKQSPDTSLYVWKLSVILPLTESNTSGSLTSTESFLASSPSAFDSPCREVQFIPADVYEASATRTKRNGLAQWAATLLRGLQPDTSSRYHSRKMTTFSITPHGIIANILIGRMQRRHEPDMLLWDLGCSVTMEFSLAKILLQLVPSYASGLKEQLYSRGGIYQMSVHIYQYGHQFERPSIKWSWEEVLLEYQPTVMPPTPTIHQDISFTFAFRSPFHFLQMLTHAEHAEHHPTDQMTMAAPFGVRLDYPSGANANTSWTRRDSELNDHSIRIINTRTSPELSRTRRIGQHTLTSIVLNLATSGGQESVLSLGVCRVDGVSIHGALPVHWANIRPRRGLTGKEKPTCDLSSHDCATDHVQGWPELTKVFHITFLSNPDDPLSPSQQSTRTSVLAFTRCLANPNFTLDLKLTTTVSGFLPQPSRFHIFHRYPVPRKPRPIDAECDS